MSSKGDHRVWGYTDGAFLDNDMIQPLTMVADVETDSI